MHTNTHTHTHTHIPARRDVELGGLLNLDILRLSARENAKLIDAAGGAVTVQRLRWGDADDINEVCAALPTDSPTWIVGSEVSGFDRCL
jgi:hypothetical protein